MSEPGRPAEYAQFLTAAGELLAGLPGPEALTRSGLAELLAAPHDAQLRTAAYAFLEAQGARAAVSPVLTWLALADHDILRSLPFAAETAVLGFPCEEPNRVAVPGCGPELAVLVDVPGRGLVAIPPEAQRASMGDGDSRDEYVTVLDVDIVAGEPVVAERVMAGRRAAMTARARLGAAAETLGACSRMIDDAIEYASHRYQFGQPIIRFQAVSDLLAWAATDRYQLRTLLDIAVRQAAASEPEPETGMVVKALAGRVSREIAQATLQVTGGIAFTWEYPHHRMQRRALVLDAFLGRSAELAGEIGGRVRQSGTIPPVFPLDPAAIPAQA